MSSNVVNIYRLQNLYKILSDFDCLKILIELLDKEKTMKELSKKTKVPPLIITHQLDYLIENNIVSKINDEYYILSDKYVIKKLKSDLKYVGK